MNPLQNLLGNIVAEKVAESAEVRLLKIKLYNFVANLTNDELLKFDEVVDALLNQAQTDSKLDGFVAGLEFALMNPTEFG